MMSEEEEAHELKRVMGPKRRWGLLSKWAVIVYLLWAFSAFWVYLLCR